MQSLDEFWSVVAQSTLVLGFALVAELRIAVRHWRYRARVQRAVSTIFYVALGTALMIAFVESLSALRGNDVATWEPRMASMLVALSGTLLILNPIVRLLSTRNADLVAIASMILPYTTRFPALIRLARTHFLVQRGRKEILKTLRQVHSLQQLVKELRFGQHLAAQERADLNAAIRAVSEGRRAETDEFITALLHSRAVGGMDRPTEFGLLISEKRRDVNAASAKITKVAMDMRQYTRENPLKLISPDTEKRLQRYYVENEKVLNKGL